MTDINPKEAYEAKKQAKIKDKTKQAQGRTAKKMGKWILILIIVVLGIYFLANAGGDSPDQQTSGTISETALAVTESDWIKGNPDAEITLIEYSDFQCPACLSYVPIVQEVNKNFSEQVRIVYRHFPLKQVHPNAEEAAWASEAAGLQGKFWEMHDILFANQQKWSQLLRPKNTFISYAEQIGLDTAQFEIDYESEKTEKIVDESLSTALSLGLNSTPSFILNGQRIQNPRSYAEFEALINSLLAKEEVNE